MLMDLYGQLDAWKSADRFSVGGKMLKFCPVNPGSKAALRGIREGDFITSINNQSTKDITNAEAHTLLRNSGDTLKLGLNEDTNRSPKRRQYKTVHQETHSETVKKSSVTSYTVTSLETSNHNGTSKPPCSSSSSSTSTYTSLPSPSGMADNGRSRRKKSKNQRKKNKYQVESPKRIKSPERKKPVKSRSLDDDSVKIEELSENDAKNDSSTSSTALVLEVESDQEVEEPPLMSPEEELTLRNFLEGLNLVKSPEEALGQVHSTIESVKSRRAQKRAALEQYFNPIVQNPRFLDVISEETSDLSDREQQTRISHHLKQGTPEPEVTPKLRKRRRILENPVLVGTRIIEVPNVEQVASTSLVEGSTRAEVVFLEDSSPEEVGELTPPPTPKNEKVFAQSDQITQKDTETSTSTSTSELDTEVTESSKPIPQIVEEKLETSLDLQLLSNLEGTSDQFSNCSSTAFEETSQKVELDFPILPVSSLEATKSNLQLEEQLSSNVDPELTTQQSFKLEAEEFKEMDYFEPVSTSETPQLEQLTPNKGYESESSNTTSETSNSIPEESLRIVDCALSVSTSSVAKECEAESKMLTNSDCESASSKILVEKMSSFEENKETSTDSKFEKTSQKSEESFKSPVKSTFGAEENQKSSDNSSSTAMESFQSVDFVPIYATSSISKRYKTEPFLEERKSSSSVSKIFGEEMSSTRENQEKFASFESSKSTLEKTSEVSKSTDAEWEGKSSKSVSKPVTSTLGAEENQKSSDNSSSTAMESFQSVDFVPIYATSSISKRYKTEPFLEERKSSSSVSKIFGEEMSSTKENQKKFASFESSKSTLEKTSEVSKSTDAEWESKSSKSVSKPVTSTLGAEENQKSSDISSFTPNERFHSVDFLPSYAISSISKKYKSEPTLEQLVRNSECESSSSISKISVGKMFNTEQNQERFPNFGRSEKTSQKASTTSQLSKNLKSVEQLSTDTEYESESSKSTFKTTVNKTFSTIPSESSHFIPSSDSKAKLEEQLSTDTEYESESTSKTSDKRTVRTENLTNLRNFSSMYNERVQKTDFVPLSSRMSKSEQFLTNKENNDEFSKTTFNKKNQSTSKPSSKVIIHKINLEPTKTVPEPNAPKTEELFENVDSFLPNSFSTSKISKSEVSTHKETKSEFSKSTFNKQSSSKPFSKEIIHKIELEPRRTEPEIFDPFSPTKIVEDSKSFSTSKISKSEQISTNKGEFSKSTIDKENLSNSKPFSKEIIHKIELEPTRTESETEKLSKTFYPFAHTKIIEDSKAFSTSSSSFRSEKTLEKHFSSLQFSKNANSDQKITKPVEIIHKIVLSDDDNNSKSGLEETNPKPLEIIHKILRSEKTEEANRSVTPPLESQEFKVSIHQEPHHYDKNQNKNSSKKDQEKSEISENGNIPESPSKEVESLCLTPRPQVSTTILSPPAPSRSPSSGSSTSFCTTKRLSTSIADISSITSNPQTLREICLYFLLSQPFGAAVLQELADVSSSLQRLTTSTPQFISSHHDPTSAPRNMNSARLQARDLTEWLHHARSKNRNDRRNSLPNAQMLYLQQKEQEIETELKRLEEEKQRLEEEMEHKFRIEDYHISKRGDFAESKKRPVSLPSEFFRQQMYNEYMDKIAQMEQRKLEKQIKVSQIELTTPETKPSGISDEFMSKVRLKQQLGKLQKPESESEHEDELLPKHLQEFVEFGCSKKGKEAKRISKLLGKNRRVFSLLEEIDAELITAKGFLLGRGVWSPGQKQDYQPPERQRQVKDEPISPVWTPKSATSSPTVEKKEFRPVKFESPVLSRKNPNKTEGGKEPPWKSPETSSDTGITLSSTLEKRLPTSQSAPISGFCDFPATRLPKAQNPTITLLQKAREGQLPKGALYIEEQPPFVGPGEILYKIKSEYTSESDSEKPRKMADLGPRKFEGIGPTTKDGMPLILRSEVKDANQSKWYKKMYDTIHKQKPHRDEFVTIKYKQRRGNYPYSSGYLSEPEPGAYDSDYTDYKYATLDRRRQTRDKENDYSVATMPRSVPETIIKHGHDPYKNQPGRIENYIPGRSSISEKEAKEWWDEVMDIFDGWLDDNSALPSYDIMFARALAKSHLEQQKRVPPQTKSFINQALKESGYESDSTLVFRRRDESTQLSPSEQKEAYKIIQKGGDIPLHGLRKPAPERPKDEPEMEYFPISPTLTRIRIHKKTIKPQREILCYPVTIHPHPSQVFANIKQKKPPSPPRRRSSRNNTTLRLISTIKSEKPRHRHETCFTSDTNVKYLRDKLTCKLGTKPKIRVSKVVTGTPDVKKVVSTVSTTKDSKTRKVESRTSVHAKPRRSTTQPGKTFGSEKKKFDLTLPKTRSGIKSSPDLLSPNEVKKAVELQKTTYKKTNVVLPSRTVPIKVGITEKGKQILKGKKTTISTIGRPKTITKMKDTPIIKQKEAIQTDHFFQNLLLRDSPLPPVVRQTTPKRTEPSLSAMKVYLTHTRPVTDSKFRSLDLAMRSRSISPKSVTFDGEKRSSSLPPKLIFSQTSRPVSPKVVPRSPSTRKIMQLKGQPMIPEVSLYSCPSVCHSTSSLESCKSTRFRDLNQFYAAIERFGRLEQTAASRTPRRRGEGEIIDFDRWKEVRTRERAEKELETLVMQLKHDAKEKGFLFSPKEVEKYRWKRELDRGLRIKEKSVDDIKEEFERLKLFEPKPPINDTYKPLWRGDSVLSLANKMVERRSLSEGRRTKKWADCDEKLLTRAIGSRIWSSLSNEQIGILKNQLSEIYGQKQQDCSIDVPPNPKTSSDLTVRRNSDSGAKSSTDDSAQTVIEVKRDEIKEKVKFFENASVESYSPTVYKPLEDPPDCSLSKVKSQSNQDFEELFGERFGRRPSPSLSDGTSRSRSLSPFFEVRTGEVRRLRSKFDGRSHSDSNLHKIGENVQFLRSKYEYPAHVGRGRSRVRRGVVSPTFLRAEDRFMPHINIISKIASLYARKEPQKGEDCVPVPMGEVEKLRRRFDDVSLLGEMFTSSPNLRELRDIAPYLAASWIAHKYPKCEDNTRSLSSPEGSAGSRDTSLVLRSRPKSVSPLPKQEDGKKRLERYKEWTKLQRPTVSFKEPEVPVPPPKGHHARGLQQESPRKYVENEVTIHYKTPVRQEIKEYLSEDELAHRQAEAMKKIYQEERRRKYLQVSKSLQVSREEELQDMNNRRHTDNFIPSQKSPIPLNRYDDFDGGFSPPVKPRPKSPEPRLMARALYNFVGQTARELTFRKGDLIYVRRQVDKNWYEGELNAMVGLFPVNYVEIVPYDTAKSTPRKSHEGQARAKYNFVAQTHLELSLAKGELVIITRRVDDNWFEGKIGGRKGIFPVSYVEVLIDPSDPPPPSSKPVASPAAHSLLLNGSAGGKESMGSHSYTPALSSNQLTSSYHAKPVQVSSYGSLSRGGKSPVNQALHIETQSEPVPYRALYKYLPQNDDELELLEGDTVYVLEKCDDGWYVGSSDRTGAFGTFPGNYVEKI
nr:PREDICTED: uncharacterized protein LOC659365 isoform X2 [Tribolium castaneum]|eukprot:XP_015839813.1 PREDICTED: uncharacterized protein LOC659365 isoform X2 [Tribolium castaneum]